MIGIFDSGVGGLSIYKEIKENIPDTAVLYLADKKNFPYGEKSDEDILNISRTNIDILVKNGAKIIVIGCNSATVTTAEILRREFDLPIIGIEPAIKQASLTTKKKQVGLVATSKTILTHEGEKLVKENQKIVKSSNNELVQKIEEAYEEITDDYLEKQIKTFSDQDVDSVALGCTHFHFIKNRLERIFPEIRFFAPTAAVVKRIVDIVSKNNIKLTVGEDIFYVTGDVTTFNKSINLLLGKEKRNVRRI